MRSGTPSGRQVIVIQIAPIELCFFYRYLTGMDLPSGILMRTWGTRLPQQRDVRKFVRPRGEIIRGMRVCGTILKWIFNVCQSRETGRKKLSRLEGSEIKWNEKLLRIMPLARLLFYLEAAIGIMCESASSDRECVRIMYRNQDSVCNKNSHISRYIGNKDLLNPPEFRYLNFISLTE